MSGTVKAAFKREVVLLPVGAIVPQKTIDAAMRRSHLYKQIATSIEHVGLIEPLVVYPRTPQDYLLLDGHIRFDILKRSQCSEVRAIMATDDESYTYNKRVNKIPPVAQHFMILKAIKNGVDEARIAAALNVNVTSIRRKRDMLDGICSETVELLKNHHVTVEAFQVLRKMKPIRQIEAAEHMIASATFSAKFARALLAVTKPEFLLDGKPNVRKLDTATQGAIAMLQQETESLVRDLKAAEASYGTDILTLTVSAGYVERLLSNTRIEKHLIKHHPDVLSALRTLISEIKPKRAAAGNAA